MQKRHKISEFKPSRQFYRVLTLGVSLLTLFTVGFLYYQARLVGRLAQLPVFEIPVKLPFFPPPAEGSSFTDLFSGTGWLNATGTALYQDFAMTTLSFPPKFEWEKVPDEEMSLRGDADDEAISPPAFIRLQEDGSDKRCLGDGCLIQKGTELLLDGQRISLPPELRTADLLNVSVGVTDKFWLVGGVIKRNVIASPAKAERGNPGEIASSEDLLAMTNNTPPRNDTASSYQGFVFKFDGENFSRVFEDNDFLSPYPGVFGFGGTSDNWLAIYGAYEGIAWQTKTKNSFSSFHNISRFFPIRVMGDSVKLQEAKERFVSFRPEAIRDGLPAQAGKNWYVYSLTSGKPKLIKLVEDEEGKISAAWDLTKNLELDQGITSASFMLEKSGSPARTTGIAQSGGLLALITKSDEENKTELWRFVDLGFDKSKPLEAVSSNINTLPGKVVSARISGLERYGEGGETQFWLSNDGVSPAGEWKEAEPYKTVVFTDPQEKLFWRVKFVPDDDLTTSPVLDRLGLEWQWVKN